MPKPSATGALVAALARAISSRASPPLRSPVVPVTETV
jgi:hypothetical protein